MMLTDWCSRFCTYYKALRNELARWTNWLAKCSPQWASYHALIAVHLVTMDKILGVFPVGICEDIRRLTAKLVQAINSHQALEACGSNKLCARLKSSIGGAVHASEQAFGKRTPPNSVSSDSHPEGSTGLKTVWEGVSNDSDPPYSDQGDMESRGAQVQEVLLEDLLTQPHRLEDRGDLDTGGRTNTDKPDSPLMQESTLGTQPVRQSAHPPNTGEDTAAPDPFIRGRTQGALLQEDDLDGCLLADAANSFNNLSRLVMLWIAVHRWPAASRFTFNCYCRLS